MIQQFRSPQASNRRGLDRPAAENREPLSLASPAASTRAYEHNHEALPSRDGSPVAQHENPCDRFGVWTGNHRGRTAVRVRFQPARGYPGAPVHIARAVSARCPRSGVSPLVARCRAGAKAGRTSGLHSPPGRHAVMRARFYSWQPVGQQLRSFAAPGQRCPTGWRVVRITVARHGDAARLSTDGVGAHRLPVARCHGRRPAEDMPQGALGAFVQLAPIRRGMVIKPFVASILPRGTKRHPFGCRKLSPNHLFCTCVRGAAVIRPDLGRCATGDCLCDENQIRFAHLRTLPSPVLSVESIRGPWRGNQPPTHVLSCERAGQKAAYDERSTVQGRRRMPMAPAASPGWLSLAGSLAAQNYAPPRVAGPVLPSRASRLNRFGGRAPASQDVGAFGARRRLRAHDCAGRGCHESLSARGPFTASRALCCSHQSDSGLAMPSRNRKEESSTESAHAKATSRALCCHLAPRGALAPELRPRKRNLRQTRLDGGQGLADVRSYGSLPASGPSFPAAARSLGVPSGRDRHAVVTEHTNSVTGLTENQRCDALRVMAAVIRQQHDDIVFAVGDGAREIVIHTALTHGRSILSPGERGRSLDATCECQEPTAMHEVFAEFSVPEQAARRCADIGCASGRVAAFERERDDRSVSVNRENRNVGHSRTLAGFATHHNAGLAPVRGPSEDGSRTRKASLASQGPTQSVTMADDFARESALEHTCRFAAADLARLALGPVRMLGFDRENFGVSVSLGLVVTGHVIRPASDSPCRVGNGNERLADGPFGAHPSILRDCTGKSSADYATRAEVADTIAARPPRADHARPAIEVQTATYARPRSQTSLVETGSHPSSPPTASPVRSCHRESVKALLSAPMCAPDVSRSHGASSGPADARAGEQWPSSCDVQRAEPGKLGLSTRVSASDSKHRSDVHGIAPGVKLDSFTGRVKIEDNKTAALTASRQWTTTATTTLQLSYREFSERFSAKLTPTTAILPQNTGSKNASCPKVPVKRRSLHADSVPQTPGHHAKPSFFA